LYGEKCVVELCKDFGFACADSVKIVVDYAIFKQTDGAVIGECLQLLTKVLQVLPISSAECERGFTQMNLYHTSGRNRL